MRSTMTAYSAGSSIFVPPSVTRSALIPCSLPMAFTRSINAGGKLYSRPHNSPIFIASPSHHPKPHSGHPHGRRTRFRHDVLHHRAQIVGLAIDAQLAIRARAVAQDGVHVVHVLP